MPDYPWDDEKEMEFTIQYIRNGLKGILVSVNETIQEPFT
jgi:hypothetical protein